MRDDSRPMMIRKDCNQGYVVDNMEIVSTRAGRIMSKYTRTELEQLIGTTGLAGYTSDELRRIADVMKRWEP